MSHFHTFFKNVLEWDRDWNCKVVTILIHLKTIRILRTIILVLLMKNYLYVRMQFCAALSSLLTNYEIV